jgi:hypothetical protein
MEAESARAPNWIAMAGSLIEPQAAAGLRAVLVVTASKGGCYHSALSLSLS